MSHSDAQIPDENPFHAKSFPRLPNTENVRRYKFGPQKKIPSKHRSPQEIFGTRGIDKILSLDNLKN